MAVKPKSFRITIELFEDAEPDVALHTKVWKYPCHGLFGADDFPRKMAADTMIEFKQECFLGGHLDDFNRRLKPDWKPDS
ncbi:hypothetical protein [Pseudomonas sp. dw_358]|uniref:hypothetical protein n=1 Tax=Pseudomonas sp. dw_358 TaxID=2720083 RepID=UPI001BD5CD6B|nr:hypothetical protein [Pseudomonas sp. dw_358]